MPDYSSDLFFLQTTILTLIGPLFTILRRAPEASPPKANFTPKGPPFHFLLFQGNIQNRTCPKGPPFVLFFGTVRLFFENFLMSPKCPPLSFLIFCNGMFVNKSRRVPPFTFSGTMRLFEKKIFKNFNFFPKKLFHAF